MLELLELLAGLLDVLVDGGELLRYWRFCATLGLSIALAVLLHHHLPWDTANALVSVHVGLAGFIGGTIWESSHRKL